MVAGGASLGLLLGGVLTEAINWHWIFFVNLPIGAAAFYFGSPADRRRTRDSASPRPNRLARLGTDHRSPRSSAIYALIKIPGVGLDRRQDARRSTGASLALLLAAFVAFEARVANPIMPLADPRASAASIASNLVRGFLVTGAFSTFFLGCALPRARARLRAPIQIGLAFLAMSVALAAMSAGIWRRVWCTRFGPKRTLVAGIAEPAPPGC